MNEQPANPVQEKAGRNRPGILAQLWDFARHNKKWWLTPIIVLLVLAGVLILLGGGGVAPFIYTRS